jgi:hypothetical protein
MQKANNQIKQQVTWRLVGSRISIRPDSNVQVWILLELLDFPTDMRKFDLRATAQPVRELKRPDPSKLWSIGTWLR